MDFEDDIPRLPADLLSLIEEFNLEKDARTKQFEDLKTQAEDDFDSKPLSMDLFTEDWNASQFWYTDATARALAKELLEGAKANTAIAIVSAPSVYIALRNILTENHQRGVARPTVKLLEFDKRFEVLGSDFAPYDFQHPLRLPPDLKGKFDRIICDPPFLSDDCQAKTALTVRHLAKDWSPEGLRLISCTGERMAETMGKLYGRLGMARTDFEVVHSNNLSNEFLCYANFECASWKWSWRKESMSVDKEEPIPVIKGTGTTTHGEKGDAIEKSEGVEKIELVARPPTQALGGGFKAAALPVVHSLV